MLPTDGEEEESECGRFNLICKLEGNAEATISQAFSDTLEDIAEAIAEAVAHAVSAMSTAWLHFSTPDMITSGQSDGTTAPETPRPDSLVLETLLGWVSWISLGICVLSLMATGAMMALRARRGEGGEHLGKIAVILVAAVLIGASSAIARALLGAGPSAAASGPVRTVQEHLWWYVGAAVVLSVIVGAAKMAWEQRADPGKDLVRALITLVVVTGAGISAIAIATRAADDFASWLVAPDSDFVDRVLEMLALSGSGGPSFGIMLMIVLGSAAMFLSLIQIMLMIIRDGMLVILAAVLPLAASFTNTEMGQNWFKKTCAWLVAFILYKPAAAIIYAVAFQMVGVNSGETLSPSLINIVTGLALMAMALVALPALMRFVIPMASLSGGGAAVGAMAGIAGALGGQVAGEMASGAISKGQSVGESEATGGDGGGGDASGADTAPKQDSGQDDSSSQEQQDADPEGAGQSPSQGADAPGQDPTGAGEGGPEGLDAAGTGDTPMPSGTGDAAAGGEAVSGANPWLAVAEGVEETGEAAYSGVKGTMNEAAEGPDGS